MKKTGKSLAAACLAVVSRIGADCVWEQECGREYAGRRSRGEWRRREGIEGCDGVQLRAV